MNNNKNRQNEGQAQGCIDFLHLTDGEWKPSESERFAWGSMQQRQESDLDSSSSGPAPSLINICFFMHFFGHYLGKEGALLWPRFNTITVLKWYARVRNFKIQMINFKLYWFQLLPSPSMFFKLSPVIWFRSGRKSFESRWNSISV